MVAVYDNRKRSEQAADAARLRRLVPCPSADPMARAAYEEALRKWLRLTPAEREAAGFAAQVGGQLATAF